VPFVSQTRYRVVSYGTHIQSPTNGASSPTILFNASPNISPTRQPLRHIYRKIPWRLSRHQKYRQRERLRHVDTIVATLDNALGRLGKSMKKVERWKMEMPTEEEMLPKDKYSVFDRKVKRYRKGIHSTSDGWGCWGVGVLVGHGLTEAEVPKWTRVSQRLNPPGF
jgi:hypothetical protein